MRIIVDIGHPAHVHFYKNVIGQMQKRGYEVVVIARDKDVALRLLKAYGIQYEIVGRIGKGNFDLIREWLIRDQKIYSIAKRFHPSILTGIHNPAVAHVARLSGAKSIIFTDTECARIANLVTFPFANVICTPSCFKKDLGRKQVRYNGYHELAYLHPNYFEPDPSVLSELGLTESDRFIIVRFVAWQASHDIGQRGFSLQAKRKLVKELGKYGRVFITSERPLPEEFEKYQIAAPPERIHDLLYHATLLVGDSQTMTTEAAILGTPAVRCNSFVGPNDMGNFIELEKRYDLIYSFQEPDKAIKRALELLQQPDLKRQWAKKRERLLADKIDVTQFMVDFIENYPQSFDEYRHNQAKTGAGK
jgi:predicted glycosyltransferase